MLKTKDCLILLLYLVATQWNRNYREGESGFRKPYRGYQHPDEIDWSRFGPDRPGKERGVKSRNDSFIFNWLKSIQESTKNYFILVIYRISIIWLVWRFCPDNRNRGVVLGNYWLRVWLNNSSKFLWSRLTWNIGNFILPWSSTHSGELTHNCSLWF